jgi:hypothetical protein
MRRSLSRGFCGMIVDSTWIVVQRALFKGVGSEARQVVMLDHRCCEKGRIGKTRKVNQMGKSPKHGSRDHLIEFPSGIQVLIGQFCSDAEYVWR